MLGWQNSALTNWIQTEYLLDIEWWNVGSVTENIQSVLVYSDPDCAGTAWYWMFHFHAVIKTLKKKVCFSFSSTENFLKLFPRCNTPSICRAADGSPSPKLLNLSLYSGNKPTFIAFFFNFLVLSRSLCPRLSATLIQCCAIQPAQKDLLKLKGEFKSAGAQQYSISFLSSTLINSEA